MKTAIVTMKEILSCPGMILSAGHWVNGHKHEECNVKLRRELEEEELRLNAEKAEEIEKVRQKYADKKEKARLAIRKKGI